MRGTDFTSIPTRDLKRALFAADSIAHQILRVDDPLRDVEEQLVEVFLEAIQSRNPEAIRRARELLEAGALDDAVTGTDLTGLLDELQPVYEKGWLDDVGRSVVSGVDVAYTLGREALLRPLLLQPSWNLVDDNARDALRADSLYWVGNFWNADLGGRIAAVIQREVIEKGFSRRDAARQLGGMFEELGKSRAYWNVVAAAATVRSRSFGTIESFVQANVETFTFLAVMDARTSRQCAHLHGRTFQVTRAVEVRNAFLLADNPDQGKAIMPWRPPTELEAMDTKALEAAGAFIPPLHGNCRSQLVPETFRE